jgi:hypothetical protein
MGVKWPNARMLFEMSFFKRPMATHLILQNTGNRCLLLNLLRSLYVSQRRGKKLLVSSLLLWKATRQRFNEKDADRNNQRAHCNYTAALRRQLSPLLDTTEGADQLQHPK